MSDVHASRTARPAWPVPVLLAFAAGAATTRVAPPAGGARWFVVAVVAAVVATVAAVAAHAMRDAARVIDAVPRELPVLPAPRRAPEAALAWALEAARRDTVDA
jgi:hypothetical protein